MSLYEQIKDVVLEFAASDYDGPMHIAFDEWASGPGKELMDKLTSTDNVDHPSNTAPVSPDKEKRKHQEAYEFWTGEKQKCPMCDKVITPDVKCHNCGEGLIGEEPKPDRHEALIREIAEEMAKKRYESSWDNQREPYKSRAIVREINSARIAVKRMAYELLDSLMKDAVMTLNQATRILIERGLIPEQEGGNDEKVGN